MFILQGLPAMKLKLGFCSVLSTGVEELSCFKFQFLLNCEKLYTQAGSSQLQAFFAI